MSKELNTVSPKKWVQSFSGVAPVIDTTDGVSNGDIAIDTSTSPNKIWRCLDNTNSAAVWHEIDLRNFTGIGTSVPADLLHIKGSDTTPDAGDITHNNVFVDAPAAGDANVWIGDQVSGPRWSWQNYRNEASEYLYLFNQLSRKENIVVNTGGRIGFNSPSNIMDYHSWYINPATGALNDMDVGGSFTGKVSAQYEVAISTIGATDTFKWRRSTDDGTTWGSYSANINIVNGTDQAVENGITVNFNAKTGHNTNDVWRFQACSQVPKGSCTVHPAMYKEVIHTPNYTIGSPVWTDVTGNMNWTQASSIDMPALGATSAIYIGDSGYFNTIYAVISSASAGLTLKVEYWNGAWTELTSVTHELTEGTSNMTTTGTIRWNRSTMTDWATTVPTGRDPDTYNLYWIRLTSTTSISTAPTVDNILLHGSARLAAYTCHMDSIPSFKVDALGRTTIGTDTATGNNQLQVVYPYGTRPSTTNSGGSILEVDSADSNRAELTMRLSQATVAGVPSFNLAKSRGTLVTPVNLATSDEIGRFRFMSYNGSAWHTLGGMRAIYTGNGTTTYGTLGLYLNNNSTDGEKVLHIARNSSTGNGILQMYNNTTAVGAGIEEFSIDGTFADNSDLAVPTEKATKTFVDGWHAYGEMYQTTNATATTIVGTGTWAKVLNFSTGLVKNVTYATSALTVGVTGTYQVIGSASMTAGNNGDAAEIAIAVGGTPQTKTTQVMKPNNSGVKLSAASSGIISLTSGNVVTLMIRNTAATRNLTITDCNVSLVRVG